MSCILHIETSTKIGSLAVSNKGRVIFNRIHTDDFAHSSCLGVFLEEALNEVRSLGLCLQAVAVSEGPGSYTGLRIGVSTAKGLCYALNIPLIAIPSLKVLTQEAIRQGVDAADYYCPMIDARRMEVYAALYDKQLHVVRETQADIVEEDSYRDFLQKGKVAFFGDGSDKCRSVITSPNAVFVPGIYPTAEAMCDLSDELYREKQFVDTAYFEPFYLKEFQATVAKNKVINKQ